MILCCGEALIDMVPDGDALRPLPGGAIFNTAIALGRLDASVQFLSGVSNDMFGQQLVDALTADKVGIDHLIRSDQPTTLAFVSLKNGQAKYTFYDENSAGRRVGARHLPQNLGNIDALYFGGISLCAEPAASAYELLALNAARSKLLMIDPNIRPSFITDAPAYRARLDRMLAVADIIKLSDEDLGWLIPDGDLAAKVAQLQSDTNSMLVLTRGSDGAEAYRGGAKIASVGAPQVEVVDTVGAGDTFNAGILAHLQAQGQLGKDQVAGLSGDAIGEALEFAARVAAVTVTRAGANPPYATEIGP